MIHIDCHVNLWANSKQAIKFVTKSAESSKTVFNGAEAAHVRRPFRHCSRVSSRENQFFRFRSSAVEIKLETSWNQSHVTREKRTHNGSIKSLFPILSARAVFDSRLAWLPKLRFAQSKRENISFLCGYRDFFQLVSIKSFPKRSEK